MICWICSDPGRPGQKSRLPAKAARAFTRAIAILILLLSTSVGAENKTVSRFEHHFADELGRWNLCKPFVVRTPLDFSYLGSELDFFSDKFAGLVITEDFSLQELRIFYAVLDTVPAWHWKGLQRIELISDCPSNKGGHYMAGEISFCENSSKFRDPNGLVPSCPGSIASRLYTILHELAHHVMWANMPEELVLEFASIMKISTGENFARFYANFLLNNNDLKRQHPKLWQFYDRKIFHVKP